MRKTILLILSTLLLQACTKQFVHEEYPLDPSMIPTFDVDGRVTITNAEPSTDKIIVFEGGPNTRFSDRHTLTDGVVQQTIEELGRHGHVVGTTKTKTIGLKVLSLRSESRVFVLHSKMLMEAVLGDGETVELTNEHTSGWTLDQDLNGCMAEGVMTLFTNQRVLAYLAQ